VKKRLGHIIAWGLLFAGFTALVSFESYQYNRSAVSVIEIAIEPIMGGHFITTDEVQSVLTKNHPGISSTFVQEVNLVELEQQLVNHPSVKQAEVYCTPDGRLQINIEQRHPELRILAGDAQFYLDREGQRVPLSPNYSVSVPIVTGSIRGAATEEEVFELWQAIKTNEALVPMISGIERTEEGDYWIFPSKCSHKVFFGRAENPELRLRKLVIFYEKALDSALDHQISWIDLTYKNQVIVKK
jgi:cell division protein FtsQ